VRTAVLALLAALALVWLGWWLRRRVLAARLGRRRRRGARAELRALRLLERGGYRLVAEQPRRTGCILVDGEPETFDLRADAVVEKDGERLVVEVKTGAAASARETRRQLLEYLWAFGLDGALLVDMAAGRIYRVEFPGLRASAGPVHGGRVQRSLATPPG
jgi:hypothetical protein